MATGPSMTPRSREVEPAPAESAARSRPGLTPVTLFMVLLLFWIAIHMGSLLVTALMAILLGTVLEGPVSRIQERRVPRAAAIAMVYVVVIAAIVGLVLIIVPVVQSQFDTFQEGFPQTVNELREDWRGSSNGLLSGPGVGVLDSISELLDEPAGEIEVTGQTAETAIPILTRVGGGIVSVITALVVTFYYLLEKKLIRRLVIEQVSPSHQDHVDRLWTSVEQKTGGWLRGQLMLCLIIGTIATTAYGIIGLSFWPLLGLWAGITEIIPIVGPWIGGVPAVIVALTEGPETAIIVGLIIVGMQSLENWFLVPRVMRGAVGLTPMTVFVAILAGTELMGVVGAILAIPIAAGVQVVLTDLMDERRSRMSSDQQTPVSGWRWMLNRGMGRGSIDESRVGEEESSNGDASVVTAENEMSGEYSGWGAPQDEPEARSDDEIDNHGAATWPANPWKGKVPAAKRPAGWRGANRPETTRPAGERDGTSSSGDQSAARERVNERDENS